MNSDWCNANFFSLFLLLSLSLSLSLQAKAERLAREIEDEQRRASGGRFRAADEAEAAGDDQGDEWASGM